jgi:CheY-like chemotaxis protein
MFRVLIVDPNAHSRALILEALWDAPYFLDEAPGAQPGLEILRRKPVDLVITEIVMPAMDGMQLIPLLRREFPTTKILATTAGGIFSPEHYFQLARALGAHATLAKPFFQQDIVDTVNSLLGAAPGRG